MKSYENNKPIYKQLIEIFIENINTGEWPSHSKIKDELTLSQELEVSRGTLRKAIKELVDIGFLTRIRGKGTFVNANILEQPLASRLVSFSEAMEQKKLQYQTIVLKKEVIKPNIKIASFLEAEEQENVLFLERVRLVDNNPVIYMKNYIRSSKCPGIINENFIEDTLFSLIESKYNHRIEWGRRYFKALPALGEVAFNLGLSDGYPTLYLEQIVYINYNQPIECSSVWINSDKLDMVSILRR